MYIVHNIYEALAEGSDMRAVFLDISKAFDRVWYRGLIAKLNSIGVEGNLLNWFISYLSGRKQRVIIEGVHSDWRNASVNSSSAHPSPPPPRADPRELAFFENELANAPPPGQKSCSKRPRGRGSKMFYFLRFST